MFVSFIDSQFRSADESVISSPSSFRESALAYTHAAQLHMHAVKITQAITYFDIDDILFTKTYFIDD